MKDAKNRDLMAKLYRLVEKYETPLVTKYADEAVDYFKEVLKDCQKIEEEFPYNHFSIRFSVALYAAIEDRFKAVNKFPLEDVPEQQTILND